MIKRFHKDLDKKLRRDFKKCRQAWKKKLKILFRQDRLRATNFPSWYAKLRALRNLHRIDLVQFVQKRKMYQRHQASLLQAAGGSLDVLDWVAPHSIGQRQPIPLRDGQVR